MTTTTSPGQLFSQIREATQNLADTALAIAGSQFNKQPYEGSWTPGQLLRHVTKSTNGISGTLKLPGEIVDRDPEQRVEELRKIFLDFSHKLKSPDFIIPEERDYEKQRSITEFQAAVESLIANAAASNLNELVIGLPLGPITKAELLHFILFHTKRHAHQLERMQLAFA